MPQTVKQRVALRCVLLFLLPFLGAAITLGTVDLIVPREKAPMVLAKIADAPKFFGADVIAAYYRLALAAALSVLICLASIWWCMNWLLVQGPKLSRGRLRPLIWGGILVAVALPTLFLAAQLAIHPGCNRLEIDDCVTGTLFKFTIKSVYSAKFTFVWDADFFASMVFLSYLLGAIIVAVTAGTAPSGALSDNNSNAQSDRLKTLNIILFLSTMVLLSAMLTAKFRFSVGLATLGAPTIDNAPNLAFLAYQTAASAIMSYWAAVLSIALGLIYLPGVYLLHHSSEMGLFEPVSSLFNKDGTSFSTLLKAAAIISPPVINKIVELLGAVPTGT